MAEDANARIRVDIDTAAALANIKNLQRQISNFHTSMAKSGAAATASSMQLQQSLLNNINRTGQFSASLKNVRTTTESFTNALEKNKLSMGEYFRYSAGATKTFGQLFRTEFDTINKVARERVKDLQTQYIKMGRDANGAMKAIAVRPLALDMENLSTKTQIAAQRQALLNQMLKQGSTNLLNFGKNTQWAGRQLMVGFTVPLAMFGAVASKTFMEMETQAIRFKRVYGEMFTTTEETEKALQEIKNIANEFTKYGVAVSKTMELAADIAATGKMGAELTAQVAQATRLAVLGGVEQQEALKATISLTDAFGTSAEELAGKIDFLNAVENQTITSIEDLTIAIPKAGPVVQQLGGDVKDLTFFLTAMREGGINASEGANALKSGLASIINPTGVAAEMLNGFGINLKGIVDANKGDVKGIVIDFAQALDQLDPLNRAQAIEQLFGKFQFARLSTLFQNVIKEGNQASRVLKLTNATTEELAILSERELKKVEESPMFKFQKALEDIKVTLVPLGEAFLKAITPLLEFGTKVLEKFNELDAGAKQFVVGLTAIAGIIGPIFIMGFGLIANGVANIIKMFTFFKTTLNKTGTASTELGMQTDYMTQQQLEASAVASSLNQVHQTLRQTFTSEAAAVNALAQAYQNAIVKQQAFAGTPLGARRGSSGGGKTQSGLNLSKGIEKVPGPKGAGDIVPANLSPGEAVIPAKSVEKNPDTIKNLVAGKAVEPKVISGDPRIRTFTNATMYTPAAFNEDLDRAKGGRIADLQNTIRNRGAALAAPITAEIAEKLGSQSGRAAKTSQGRVKAAIANPQTAKKLQTFANEFNKNMSAELANLSAKGVKNINQREFAKISEGVVNKAAAASGIDKKLVKGIMEQQTTVRTSTGSRRGIFASGITPYTKKQAGYGQMAQFLNNGKAFDPAGMHMAHLTNAERLSPEEARGLAKPGSPLGASMLKEIEAKEQSIATTKKATKEEVKKERAMRGATQEAKNATKAVNQKTEVEKAATKATKAETAAKKQQAAIRPTPARGANGRFISSKTPQPIATQTKPGMKMGGGAIGMAASGAVMAGSMLPGDIGKISQDLMMPVMLASMILPMLKPPVALAAVAVGTLAAGAIALKGAFDKAQDESFKLTEAMGGGTKAIKGFAEFSGVVSAGEIMQRRRANEMSPFAVQTGKTTFGESFVQSEAGKGMVGAARQSIASIGRQATQGQLVNQLVTAVASGALGAVEARSVAASIAQEIGDMSFGINVNAKLIELLGPNGENLVNDPLEVRLKLVQDTQKSLGAATANMQKAQDPLFQLGRAASITGALAAGGALVAGPIGAVAGTVAGIALTANDVVTSFQQMGTASGAMVASGMLALQQQQEMVDSLDLQYQQRIEAAKAAGDLAKVEELTTQHIKDRNSLLAENATTMGKVLEAYTNAGFTGQGAMGQAVDKAIEDRFADDPIQKALAISARDQIVGASGLNQTQEYQMKLLLSTGSLDPNQVLGLLNTFGKDGEQLTSILNIMTKFGTAEGNRAVQLMNMFVDKDGNPDTVQQKKFIANLETKTPAGADKYLDLFAEASKLGGAGVIETSVIMTFYNNNPGAAAEFQAMMDKINAVDGKMSMTFVQNLIGNEEFQKFKENEQYFNSLDPVSQKTFMSAYVNTMQLQGDKDMQEAYRAWIKTLPASQKGRAFQDFAITTAVRVTDASIAASKATQPVQTPSETGGGGGRKADPLDGILKALKNVRQASIDAQGGVKELFRLFDDGKNITVFKGLETQLMNISSNTEFANFISGLDKAEQKLFVTIKNGNVELTKRGRLLEKAYNAKIVGDFVLSQERLVLASKNELASRNELIKAGYSYVEAVKMAKDADIQAAYAAALATKGKRAQKAAIDAVNNAIKEGLGAQKAAETAEEKFAELYGKIQDKLDADRTAIELKFKLDSAADDKIITDAQNKIAEIQYKLDDQEAGLFLISEQEDKINTKYDKRLDALNKIKTINDRLAQQQRTQLSLADALSSGDMGAAALAMQEFQQNWSQATAQNQEDLIEKARQQELLNVTTLINGEKKTRVQIEEEIKKLQKEIFDQEEKFLEPAQERNRQLIVARDAALLKLDIENDKWVTLQNSIDLAKTKTLDYAKALEEANKLALAAVQAIENPKSTLPTGATEPSTDDTGGAKNAGAGGPGGPGPGGPVDLTREQIIARDQAASKAAFVKSGLGAAGFIKLVDRNADKKQAVINSEARRDAARASANAKATAPKRIQPSRLAGGGMVGYYPMGGLVPYMSVGGPFKTVNTDSVPAMLTPGEFVIRRSAVEKFGQKNLSKINDGNFVGNSVYNYSVNVNVKTDANPDVIARTVVAQIKQVNNQRIRGLAI